MPQTAPAEPKYCYTFTPHPDPQSPRWNPEARELLKIALRTVCLDFTEREFNAFREAVARTGFELCEVERVPYHHPESVL